MQTQHGFKTSHPALLAHWANQPRDHSNAAQNAAYREIVEAYEATAAWARHVQAALFPQGTVFKRSSPTDQAQKFKPYTWTRIYPRTDAPKKLAYTVGIDSGGEFCVKLDTVSADREMRERYVAIRGGDHASSPISAVLPFQEGMNLSLEGLTAWAVKAVGSFEPGYGELARRIGVSPGPLRLVNDSQRLTAAFRRWADVMADGALRRGALLMLPKHKIVFQETAALPIATRLGLDPRGVEWGVEINEPSKAGDYNVLSAIGEDDSGGLYLLRQGWLRGRRSAPDIREEAFTAATGLQPAEVRATGGAEKRRWFLVAHLDSPPETIRRETARFADLCWLARSPTPVDTPPVHTVGAGFDEDGDVDNQIGRVESGGWFIRSGSEAREPERFRLRHGEVWIALTARLAAAGVTYRKRGQHGFEIDLEIDRPSAPPLLIEIKSGGGASTLHTGIGQLYLYRKLVRRLESAEPVLLMEGHVTAPVRKAVKALGVALHHYEFRETTDEPEITFSPDFLALCGVH